MESHPPEVLLPSHPPSLPPVTWRFPSHMFESFIQANTPDYEDVSQLGQPSQPEYLKQEFHPDLQQQMQQFRRRHGEFYFKQKLRYETQQKKIEENIKEQVQRYQEQQHRQHLEYLQTQQYIREEQTRLCNDLEAHCQDEFDNWECQESEWYDDLPVSAPPQVAPELVPDVEVVPEDPKEEKGLSFRAGGKTRTTFPVKNMATQQQGGWGIRIGEDSDDGSTQGFVALASQHPIMLHLAGVTTDSSSDDASMPSLRKSADDVSMSSLQRHRKDLSMDSGIQGSSCDLADCSDPEEAAEDVETQQQQQQPNIHAQEYETIKMGALSAEYNGEILHGETFNLVEEVVVEEDSKNRFQQEDADDVVSQSLYRATPRKIRPDPVHRSQSNANRTTENATTFAPRKHRRKKATSLAEGNTSAFSLDGPLSSSNFVQDRCAKLLSSSLNSVIKPPRAFRRVDSAAQPFVNLGDRCREDSQIVLSDSLEAANIETTTTPATTCCRDVDETTSKSPDNRFVVVAIDFGTTYSGYAFSFIRDQESNIHMMRKWEGGDPGLNNQKIPTTLLLTPEGDFHSFGFSARDYFHDLDPQEAKRWLFLDKFKMALHDDQDVSRACELRAANGRLVSAVRVFSLALRHLKELVLTELSDHVGGHVIAEDVRWVLTVPAIWRQPAKQLMREAAYQAGVCDPAHPEGLLIALEPECASICCRKLRLNHLVPERMAQDRSVAWSSTASLPVADPGPSDLVLTNSKDGLRYVVVDCGGGTVDITVHELSDHWGTLRELHRATGGPWGSVRVDFEFERLLEEIFGADFIAQFKMKRPAAFVELMLSFEARKRSASPYKDAPLNVFPPFAFIDYYRKYTGREVEHAVKKLGRKEITWSSQGMLRLQPSVMREMFGPTVTKIIDHIRRVIDSPSVGTIEYLFLVGGFSESQILQCEVRTAFKDKLNVIIPQGVSLAILRGAVLFGLNPTLITTRRSKQTYGVGIMKRFDATVHPRDKLVLKDGVEWCADILDKFVISEQAVELGESVLRRYTPACSTQSRIVINIYCADGDDVHFITDPGVTLCGTLSLEIEERPKQGRRLEIHTRMVFGGTEISASALDVSSGHCVQIDVDFLTS